MGTFNFKSQEKDFYLYAMLPEHYAAQIRDDYRHEFDSEEEFEEWARYDFNNSLIWDDVKSDAEELNGKLMWHHVEIEPGYYEGFQFDVVRDVEEDELGEEVWGDVVDGPEGRERYHDYPWHASFDEAISVLGDQCVYDYWGYDLDWTLVSDDQVDLARQWVDGGVGEMYRQEIDTINNWLSSQADRYGMKRVLSNGWVERWEE